MELWERTAPKIQEQRSRLVHFISFNFFFFFFIYYINFFFFFFFIFFFFFLSIILTFFFPFLFVSYVHYVEMELWERTAPKIQEQRSRLVHFISFHFVFFCFIDHTNLLFSFPFCFLGSAC